MITDTAFRIYLWLHLIVWPVVVVVTAIAGVWDIAAFFTVAWVILVCLVIKWRVKLR